MKNVFYAILLIECLCSCHSKKFNKAAYYSDQTDSSSENIYNFKVIKSQFKMRVISFVGSNVGCGVVTSCSSCIGINENNDTIRVLTECPEMYGVNSLYPGQKVKVMPDSDTTKNKLSCSLSSSSTYVLGKKNNKQEIALENRKFPTIYGVLSLILE